MFLLLPPRLIVACISFYYAPYNRRTSRLIVVLIRHVICASIVPVLPSGGDYLHRSIVGSLVGGVGGGCAKGGSTTNGTNAAARSEDVRRGIGGVWFTIWETAAAMVVSLRWLVESGNSSVERAEGEAS